MATAKALAPILAQQFCDSRTTTSGVAFDMISATSAASTSPKRTRDRSVSSPKGANNDIFSLTDTLLAERYQFKEEVGYGNWGSVWLVHPKVDGEPQATKLAIKLVHRSKNPTSSARVRSLWTEFKCIRALKNTPHENIIEFHAFIITPSYALISMAHQPNLMPVELPESKARAYFQQLISAVDFLHSHGTTHNDVKPANILLSADDKPVLCDFGFAQQYDLSSKERFLSNLSWGTPEYLSPERAKGILHDERLSDTWALGVTMYEIVVGRTPFEKSESEEFLTRDALEVYYHRTTSGSFCGDYSKISPEFESLIHAMVQPNINLRLQTCGHALRHRFFAAPPLQQVRSTQSLVKSLNSKSSATPPRSIGGTPTSSAQKSGRKGPKAIKIYQDDDSPTPSRVARPIGTPSRVLSDRNDRVNAVAAAAALRQTPSKIPIRKVDISSPEALDAVAPSQVNDVDPVADLEPGRRRSPGSTNVVHDPETLAVAGLEPRQEEPARLAAALLGAGALQPREAGRAPTRRGNQEVACPIVTADEDQSPIGIRVSSSPASPSTSFFTNASTPSTSGFGTSDDLTNTSFGDVTNTDYSSSFAVNQTLPLPPVKSSTSLASKLRKLSLRRAPSKLSFRAIKSSISHRALRRASSSSSLFSMIDAEPVNKEDRGNRTMPLSLGRALSGSNDPEPDHEGEREKLESFSRRIQHIIDAQKKTDSHPHFQRRSVAPMSDSSNIIASSEIAILSPAEVQEFRQQVEQELAEDRRKKDSLSDEEDSVAPRAGRPRASTLSRSGNTSHVESIPVKIRPSLAPSFIGSTTGSCFSMLSNASGVDDLTATFKPGHRRIPTAIRSLPSILLTESADDESDREGATRSETPGSIFSERIASPPPTPRIVEESRQLPMWVPEELSSDEDDADIDEPTIKIDISTPTKLRRRTSSTLPTLSSTTPSSGGLFQQFVAATPGISRRVRVQPPAPVPIAVETDSESRSSSRATTHTTDTQLSRKRSVMSFLFHSNSRPVTPSPSLASASSVSTTDVSDAGEGKPRRAGKFKRALKALLK
ncbi:hypothetical protein RQP46_007702 [Phenoliferia psychrophenolica]